jgi:hypothetical protein
MKSNAVIGIAIVIVGVIVIAIGAYTMYSGTFNSKTSLLGTNSYLVAAGDNQAVGFTVPSATTISGTFTQNNGTSVNFYLMTGNQQNAFGNCAPCASPSMENISSQKIYNFNWALNSSGTYYLVLDNSNGNSAVSVSLTANSVSGNSNLPTYIIIIGVVIAIIGGVVAAMGPSKPKASIQKKPDQQQPVTNQLQPVNNH